LEERSRRLLAQKTRDKNIKNENDEKIQKRNNAFDEEIRSHIVWPILPHDDEGVFLYITPLSYTSVYCPPPTYSLVLLFRTSTCFFY
jgi:hypothetical protein